MNGAALTVAEAAQVARVHAGTIRLWIAEGIVMATKPDGRYWAIQEKDLLDAIATNPPGVRRGMKRKPGQGKPGAV